MQNKEVDIIPLNKWNDYFDYPKVSQLRWLVWNEHKNGFNKVIRRLGYRVYIKVSAFNKWLDESNQIFDK